MTSLFKRKSRRSTTLTISDHTRSSKGSLSSVDGSIRASSHGSSLSLGTTPPPKGGSVASVKSESKIKQTRFSDDTNGNGAGSPPSAITNGISPSEDNYFPNDHTKSMTLLGDPGANTNLGPDVPTSGAPMELYASVIKGDKVELKKIITGNPKLLNTADNFGRTPLMYCVLADRLDCAKFLINMGCDLDQVDNAGRSATHSAAHKGSYKFLELLHKRGASLDIKDNDGQTPLHLATRIPNPKCLEFLLRNLGPGMVDIPDNQMRTALHWSAAFNNTECVKLLIKYGINIALTDAECKTPLHWAANNHDPSAVHTMKALLEKSPSVLNWQDSEGRTALHCVVAHGSSIAVEFLVNFKAEEFSELFECDPDRADYTYRTPLHWAAQLGNIQVVELLLQGKAKLSSSDGNGATPFLYAALTDKHAVVEIMIEHDPKVTEFADIEGRNALMWAAAKGSNNVIRTLLGIEKLSSEDKIPDEESEKGSRATDENRNEKLLNFTPMDVNKLDNKGNTALHAAARNGHGASVEILLKHGARPDIANTDSHHTAIFGACEKGHVNCVTYLLDYKASVTIIDSENRTPLHWAALGGHAEVCDLLLREGLDVDVRDKQERTPLHCAAFGGFINCMNLLLESGANVDVQDHEGHSALHWAAQSGHLDAIKLLFQYSVFPNPMEYTEERLTPLDHALQKENEDVMHYLIEQGALSAEHIRNIAAMRIQAYFRGYKVRRTKKILMRTLALRKEKRKQTEAKENAAATRIQAYYRGYKIRKNFLATKNSLPESSKTGIMEAQKQAAAIKIQAYYRGYLVRKGTSKISPNTESEEERKISSPVDSYAKVTAKSESEIEEGFSPEEQKEKKETDLPGEIHEKTGKIEEAAVVEVDSGSHSPEHEAESMPSKSDARVDPPGDLNVFSNDEGVICDQASTSSSHSSINRKVGTEEYQNAAVIPSPQSLEDKTSADNEFGKDEERIISPVDAIESGTAPEHSMSLENTESMRSASMLGSREPTSERFNSVPTLTPTVAKNKKSQKRKTRRIRSQRSARPDVPDSDSSKDHHSLRRPSSSSTTSLPTSDTTSSSSKAGKRRDLASSQTVSRKLDPTPPPVPKEVKSRKKILILPKKKVERDDRYPRLDGIGNPDNIQSEKVKGIARRPEPVSDYYVEQMDLVPITPVKMQSDALGLSEFVESLMTMSPEEKRQLREHQDKRRKAFQVVNDAAALIQRTWVRYLRHKNPSMHKKFLSVRKKSLKRKKLQLNDTPTVEHFKDKDEAPSVDQLDQSAQTNIRVPSRSSMKQNAGHNVAARSSNVVPHTQQSVRTVVSTSDVSSSTGPKKNAKTRRPGTSGHGATFVSLERLEELSKIYGHPKMMRDLLSNASRSSTSFPSISSGGGRSTSDYNRPKTAADSSRQMFEKSLRGTSAYIQPSTAVHSPRPWVGLPSVSGKSRLTGSTDSRNSQRSKSGRSKQNVDYRMMPLQWQKLYGELQSANATDAKRKRATRFSYNIGEIS